METFRVAAPIVSDRIHTMISSQSSGLLSKGPTALCLSSTSGHMKAIKLILETVYRTQSHMTSWLLDGMLQSTVLA